MLLLDADALAGREHHRAVEPRRRSTPPPDRRWSPRSMVHGTRCPTTSTAPRCAARWPGCTAPTPRRGSCSRPTTSRTRCPGCPHRTRCAGRCGSPAAGETVYVAGDHRDTSSIQGALVSGRRAAHAVLADLGVHRMTRSCWPTPSTPRWTGPSCRATPRSATGCAGRCWEADDPPPGSLRGKTVVVTGGELRARQGHRHRDSPGSARRCTSWSATWPRAGRRSPTIRGEVPGAEVLLHRCDVSDLSSVRAFAAALRGSVERVDVLVHNAGALPPERQETADGHEVALATHVLGPLLMTELLRPAARRGRAGAGGARVLGRDVRPEARGRGPGVPPGRVPRHHRLRPHQADAGRADAADAGALGRRRDRRAHDAPRLGRHPGRGDVAARVPQGDGAAAARRRRPARTPSCGSPRPSPRPGGGQFWHDRAPRPEHYLRRTRETGDEDLRRLWAYVLDAARSPADPATLAAESPADPAGLWRRPAAEAAGSAVRGRQRRRVGGTSPADSPGQRASRISLTAPSRLRRQVEALQRRARPTRRPERSAPRRAPRP